MIDTEGMRRSVVALAVLLALTGCGGSEPRTLTGIKREPPLQVGTVTLPEVAPASGDFVMKASDPDRLLVTYFGYTNCPDLCPSTFAALRKAVDSLEPAQAERIDIAFVTVDPERDTGEILGGYLASFFGDRWHALRTDDPAALAAAEEPFLVSSSVETTFDGRIAVEHTATTYIIDVEGTVVAEWGYPTKAEDMSGDLAQLLEEAA